MFINTESNGNYDVRLCPPFVWRGRGAREEEKGDGTNGALERTEDGEIFRMAGMVVQLTDQPCMADTWCLNFFRKIKKFIYESAGKM